MNIYVNIVAEALLSDKLKREWKEAGVRILVPVTGVAAALLIGAIFLIILDADPFGAYGAMVRGAVGTKFGITQTLAKATPLLLVGLGISIAFRASCINIGGEGQMIAGAIVATWFPLAFSTLPGFILIPATILMGFLKRVQATRKGSAPELSGDLFPAYSRPATTLMRFSPPS